MTRPASRQLTLVLVLAALSFSCGDGGGDGLRIDLANADGGADETPNPDPTTGPRDPSDPTTPPVSEPRTCPVVSRRPIENEVATETGWVRGELDSRAVSWRGIPFAAPPIGRNRFRAPEPALCWDGVRDATEFGPRCPQLQVLGDEDCLTLNVWAPRDRSDALKPVMVWIYGGGNDSGSASDTVPLSEPLYDGTYLADDGDVVVVTFNYRVGTLGWLAHDALDSSSPHGVSGNYGLQDQLAALRWVQRNISNFGGDPTQVTLFGESAGALNTCMLIASPAAAGLFHGAILQSGECIAPSIEKRKRDGETVAGALGCTGDDREIASCLRSASARDVASEVPVDPSTLETWFLTWGPGVDGELLPDSPLALIDRGEHNAVPVMIGSNADETEVFVGPLFSCDAVRDFLDGSLPGLTDTVLEQYPCDGYPAPRQAVIASSTDLLFTCPTRRNARRMAAAQAAPVYRYLYRYQRSDPLLA
ncbi:MAG: carboxylesterase family protein, partial [Myxococcota bacterium]